MVAREAEEAEASAARAEAAEYGEGARLRAVLLSAGYGDLTRLW